MKAAANKRKIVFWISWLNSPNTMAHSTPLSLTAGSSPGRAAPLPAGLLWVSLLWAWVGWYVAYLAPWRPLAGLPEVLDLAAPVVTAILIALNIRGALRVLWQTGRPLPALPITLVQLLLFTLLFYQIAAHLGAQHFELDAAPRWWDWLGFSAAHALRATDLLDVIEAYGLHIQSIRHKSPLVVVSLIVFHLVVNLFVVALVLALWNRLTRALTAHPGRARLAVWLRSALLAVFLVAWIVSIVWVRPWNLRDVPLWLVDNVLRVLDCADVMDTLNVRLHQVPAEPWEGTLTVLCRVVLTPWLGLLLGRLSLRVRLRYLGGLGLDHDELRDLQAQDDDLGRMASWHLQRYAGAAADRRWWLPVGGAVLLGACAVPGILRLPSREEAADRLATEAIGDSEERARAALAALSRLGPEAERQVPVLMAQWPHVPAERRPGLVEVVAASGTSALEHLDRLTSAADPEVALTALRGLRMIGPRAAPQLVHALAAPSPAVRAEAEAALLDLGEDAVPPLLDNMTLVNAPVYLKWIDRLDRNWPLRSTENEMVQEAILKRYEKFVTWRQQVRRARPMGASGFNSGGEIRTALKQYEQFRLLLVLAVAELRALLREEDREVRRLAAAALREVGPEAREAVPELRALLNDEDREVRWLATEALGAVGPEAREAVGDLQRILLRERNEALWGASAAALDEIDPEWTRSKSVAGLVQTLLTEVRQWVKASSKGPPPIPVISVSKGTFKVALPASGPAQPPVADGRAALQFLGRLGPTAAPATRELIELLGWEDDNRRAMLADVLDRIDSHWQTDPKGAALVDELCKQLSYTRTKPLPKPASDGRYWDPSRGIYPKGPFTLGPEFFRRMDSERAEWDRWELETRNLADYRYGAAKLLGRLRTAAQAVRPRLEALAEDKKQEEDVREAARAALTRLSEPPPPRPEPVNVFRPSREQRYAPLYHASEGPRSRRIPKLLGNLVPALPGLAIPGFAILLMVALTRWRTAPQPQRPSTTPARSVARLCPICGAELDVREATSRLCRACSRRSG